VIKNQKKKQGEKKPKSLQWTKSGTFSTFVEADEERNVLSNDETLQVKVRRRHSEDSYTVHYRKNSLLKTKEKKIEKKERAVKKKRTQKKR
jgi:hypothetical protein|tara:strand:+ start:4384 stop:4656 length:273 start_codon:yes stop_codon:yes gene_type:complete